MKVLLTGCGAVGIGLAASLYDSGIETFLIAKGKTYEAIKNGGIKRTGIFKEVTVSKEKVKVFQNAKDTKTTGFNYVIVACKTTAQQEVAKELSEVKNLLSENGIIVLFQNGFFNDRPFLKYFDKKRMFAGSIITGFDRPERNVSRVTVHSAPAQIGALYSEDSSAAAALAEKINEGGQPCAVSENIISTVWSKMLYNCSLNPLSALLNTNYGGLVKCPEGKELVSRVIEEMFDVMSACDYKVKWANAEEYKKDFFTKILPPTYGHRSSTLQDIERRIKTEIDSLTGVVVALGKKHNVAVPVNSMILSLIKIKESLYLN